jgi:hypothetical protein
VAEIPVEIPVLEAEARPLYQQVAQRALHLREVGLSNSAIARKLEVDDKRVAKAVRWLRRMRAER